LDYILGPELDFRSCGNDESLGILTRKEMKSCRACGSSNTGLLFEIEERRVRRCGECTHVYLDVVHDAESIRSMYSAYGNGGQSHYFAGIDREVETNLDGYLHCCKAAVRNHDSQLRLLDVGCGNGALLRQAQSLGFVASGVEISPALASLVKEQLRCEVYEQLLSELDLPESSFDVVTMYDLIEHTENPRQDLEQVFRVLKSGGVFFVLTPNDQALLRRISRVLFAASLQSFSSPMRRLYYPDHLSYFTAESLSRLLASTGFELISLESMNQELSRVQLSSVEKLVARTAFWASRPFPRLGGKLVAFARRP
jgi:2-polyprenyl-3-methyl-5-hydroxy-6-metoxy-1,4-benzoquinol methylase